MNLTIGAHNLHDERGVVSFYSDIIIFTEAIAPTIRAKAKRQWAHAKARLAGYRIITCRQQPDLVVAVRRRLVKVRSTSYTGYVKGWAKVTPNRGTFLVLGKIRKTGQPVAVVAEHRINAAFKPWVRGEPEFRERAWNRHTAGTLDTIERLVSSGYLVLAGGDLNTPRGVSGYQGKLREVGVSLDRLGCSRPAHIGGFEELSRKGSDHPRVRAEVTVAG